MGPADDEGLPIEDVPAHISDLRRLTAFDVVALKHPS
jgi:hypothetical protein